MIQEPSLILTFTANDLEAGHESVQTITGDDLLTRSISIEHRLLDGLKPSSDKAELSIRKGAPVVEDIIRTEGDIHAVLMDGMETLFTGYVSTNFSWSVTDYGEETLSITPPVRCFCSLSPPYSCDAVPGTSHQAFYARPSVSFTNPMK